MKKSLSILLLCASIFVACIGTIADAKSNAEYYENLSRLTQVLNEVNRKYVENVPPDKLVDAAIDGLKDVLDPHTAVYNRKQYGDLKVSTAGEFGGLGITIAIREEYLTVISPLAGTPAYNMGLRAGDKIVKIEGKNTKGITIDKAVEKLRGKVGTNVTISVAREGVGELIEFTITRAIIKIHSVPYSGMVSTDIGYIKVVQFSQKTTGEVQNAINELKGKGMKKLVLDLRYNPGGLLSQAINIGDLFLDKGQVIVSTKGRTQESHAKAENPPLVDQDMPLVVLVNQGSASASEIVSGALQDWDRAVIMGETTFGKGSVQTVTQLDNQENALKLTTAFYYLPKGRCINKPENGIQGKEDEADTTKQVFLTAGGRKMYGGGGIEPDIEVSKEPLNWYQQALERKSSFFNFVVKYRSNIDKKGIKINKNWVVSEDIVEDFKDFLAKDTSFQNIKTTSQTTLEMLADVIKKEQDPEADSTSVIRDPELMAAFDAMKKAIENKKHNYFEENKDYIRRGLKREFLAAILGEKKKIEFNLTFDNQLAEAKKYLQDMSLYESVLKNSSQN